jgi:hypothetical protein
LQHSSSNDAGKIKIMVEQDIKSELQEQIDFYPDKADMLMAMFHSTLESYLIGGKILNYEFERDPFLGNVWHFRVTVPQDPYFVIAFALYPHEGSYLSFHEKSMVLR